MASRFDPSAFIAAEARGTVETVEARAETVDAFRDADKTADFRRFRSNREANNRTVEVVEAHTDNRRPWAADLARLQAFPCPSWLRPIQWDELVWECLSVDRDWGDAAIDLGWSVFDLFGCHERPWVSDGSQDGLVAGIFRLLSPVRITGLWADRATLQPPTGPAMHHYRYSWPRPKQSLLWRSYASGQGP